MKIKVVEEKSEKLSEYEKVTIAYLVESFFRIELFENGLGGIKLIEERLKKPFIKDYDSIPEEKPSKWIDRFDILNWGILSAFDGEQRIGGATIAWKTPKIAMLEGREDLACYGICGFRLIIAAKVLGNNFSLAP